MESFRRLNFIYLYNTIQIAEFALRYRLNLLLCRPGQSQLFTSTMLWRASGLSSLEDYLESSLGIMKSLFPTVLGLKLAEDLDLGRRFEPRDLTNINSLASHFSVLGHSSSVPLVCRLHAS